MGLSITDADPIQPLRHTGAMTEENPEGINVANVTATISDAWQVWASVDGLSGS